MLRHSLFTGIALTSIACGGEVEEPRDIAARSTPIINGEPAEAPYHASVVSLHLQYINSPSFSPKIFCSGTLIAEDVVLTAAHCLDGASGNRPTFSPRDPSTLAVYIGDDPSLNFASNHRTVQQVRIHEAYDRLRLHNDIGVLRLTAPLAGATTAPHLSQALALGTADVGTLLDFVGFGYSDIAKTDIGVKLHAETPLGALGCPYSGCPQGAPMGTQISYQQAQNGPCNGDSGGPAFIDRGGAQYVAGVTSYGDSACTSYGVSTRVDAFSTWLDGFLVAPPPPPSPDCSANGVCNAECAADADPDCGASGGSCDSDGLCEAGESCDGRNGTAKCSDCPGVVKGKPSARYCWVEGSCQGPACS